MADVDRRVAQDVHAREAAGHEVEPALLVVQAGGDVVDAVKAQAIGPPAQERQPVGRPGDAEDPAVEHAGQEDRELTRRRRGLEQVRREHDRRGLERRQQRVEAVEHEALLLDEHDALGAAVEQIGDEVRRQRVAQLLLLIAEAKAGAVVEAEGVEPDELVRLARRVEATVDLVGEQREERDLRVVLAEAPRKQPRVGQVWLGDDRRGGGAHHAVGVGRSAVTIAAA